ncbi:hypothetical protein BGZ96_002261 [Linnemannia gamsii]|uniref:Uncharacterized protein n=1 Tax=Linnemannia gamsii TaxID=64522 RepID=A0ABQ7K894_9FUNG|nr:hypothetical protein BGZ96_002261 [Linnemannia gamsii]
MSDTSSSQQPQQSEVSLDLDSAIPVSIDTKAINNINTSVPTSATLADKASKDVAEDTPFPPSSTFQETIASPSSPSPAPNSFYDGLDLDLEGASLTQSTTSPSPSPPLPSTTQSASAESGVSNDSNVSPSTTNRFGAKKVRVNPGSNISRRITMLAAGKNENGSDLHTNDHTKAPWGGDTTPDGSEYPDSFFEEILREDQANLSRSSTTIPKPTPRSTTLTSKTSMPLRLPSSTSKNSTAATGEDAEPAFVSSGDVEDDLKRLQAELTKTKDTKSKAEADAKAQRVTVMSLKTEVQLVRNVLKRRETELGDVKDMSNAYESELAELRQKLEQAERQLSRGQGEMEAKVRSLERLRDESIARIQTLDQEIKKLRDQLAETEKSNNKAQAELGYLRSELEELAPYRDAALEQREFKAQEPIKIKELSDQITKLEDTRDVQSAMIEELETKITTVEAEALEFKGKAELEYEQLSDGFKVLKTRRSEEIKVLKAELEQHKLQEQIIEKLQADIDQLQSALSLVASSQSTENARINQVTAELNEALALKDQEVVQVRQNMTEFEESHNRLVSSLQATLATINEEADSARRSRDEAVSALESLREELEALRHSLPINNKHMSLSQWSAEQQQTQQDQLKAIQELEDKLDGQVTGVKEDHKRAGILEANTKRKSQQLTLDLEHHLQLSNALVQQSNNANTKEDSSTEKHRVPDLPTKAAAAESTTEKEILSKELESPTESGSVSVRTMLKFLSQLQGRPSDLKEHNTTHHSREDTQMTVTGDNNDFDYEEQLRVYLTQLNDVTLVEPWAKEKELEHEIQQLEQKIQNLLGELSTANQKQATVQDELKASFEAQLQEERDQRDHLELLEREEREEIEEKLAAERRIRDEEILEQQQTIQIKEQELHLKESTLRERELYLRSKEQELISKGEAERHKRADSFPATPPFSAPITPFGSPGNADLLPNLLAAQRRSVLLEEDENDGENEEANENEAEVKRVKALEAAKEREHQAEMAAQQAKLIKSLEDKIAQLEKRAEDHHQQTQASSFPSPPMSVAPRMSSSLRSSLLANPPDTPPPTIALPPIPTDQGEPTLNSPRLSPAISEDGTTHHHPPSHPRKKSMSGVAYSHSIEALGNKATAAAATEAAAMSEKLAQFEADLAKTQSKNKQLETELVTVQKQQQEQGQTQEVEARKFKQENAELTQVLEEIRQSLDQAQNQARGLEAAKTQLEAQVQKERQAKDDANRMRDRLQTQLEEEMQKKKGGFLCF